LIKIADDEDEMSLDKYKNSLILKELEKQPKKNCAC
jgi:hypothetical protein